MRKGDERNVGEGNKSNKIRSSGGDSSIETDINDERNTQYIKKDINFHLTWQLEDGTV